MSTSRRVPLRLIRFKNFLLVLLKNKMAFTGLVLLVLFSVGAIAAPLITPYDPQGTVVTAPLAKPGWMPLLTGPSGWSQNIQFSGLRTTSDPSIAIQTTGLSPTSATIQVTSNPLGGNVTVQKSLNYPYSGSAQRFIGHIVVLVNGLPASSPSLVATLALQSQSQGLIGPNEKAFWGPRATLVGGGTQNSPYPQIDSISSPFNDQIQLQNSNQAAQILFSRPVSDFLITLDITLPKGVSGLTITIQNFQLQLYGNAWGVFGSDDSGRDVFTQVLYGARLSLEVGLLATFIGVGLGLLVGLVAGYLGKVVDEVLMRFTDMMLVVPGLPLLIVLASILGSSLLNIIIILGFLGWMGFARLVRAQVLSLRERPFIEAAKASGAGTGYTLLRHVFPNVVSLTYVNLALAVPAAIVGEAALSFLGLGDETVITWGRMLAQANESAGSASNLPWWWVIPPGLAIALISLSFILIGYSLDEIFNPRLRRRR